jgi:hypothetical protein
MRADVTSNLGRRLELDARMFERFEAGTVGWTLGIAHRF